MIIKKSCLMFLFLTLCIPSRNTQCFNQEAAATALTLSIVALGVAAIISLDERDQRIYNQQQKVEKEKKEELEKAQQLAREQQHKDEQLALEKIKQQKELENRNELERQQEILQPECPLDFLSHVRLNLHIGFKLGDFFFGQRSITTKI